MPHKKSAKKRLRQNERLNQRNRAIRSTMATAVKKARAASPDDRQAALKGAVSAIDKAAKAGVIKKETASRKKSRLAKELGRAASQ